jgi:putative nucleotidyltransferase with HDIG domain
MAFSPPIHEEDLLARTLERARAPLHLRDGAVEALIGAGFFAAVALLLVWHPPTSVPPLLPAIGCILVLAIASRAHFYVASGFTVPTQLAYVPLLFAVPTALAPLAVAVALVTGRLPGVLHGTTRVERLLHCPGNAWFAIGPAVVFAAFDAAPAKAVPEILMLALVAQFGVDFVVSYLRDKAENGTPLRQQLSETWVYAVDAALSPVGLAVAYSMQSRPALVLGLIPMIGLLAVFARERQGRLESLIELKDAYHGTALVLGDVVEADDNYTGMHSKSVVGLSLAVGHRLGLDADRLRNLEFGALLHDVGKVAIPKEIINKPGKLDPDEWTLIKTHTVEGQRMLDRIGGFMREVGLIVRSHHERWDGGGYPDELAGDKIPLESRIISCCDTWNAMRTDRPYRKALPHDEAVAELRSCAGTQLDPHVVEAFLTALDDAASTELVRESRVLEPVEATKH